MFRKSDAPCKLNNVTKRKHQTDCFSVRNYRRQTKVVGEYGVSQFSGKQQLKKCLKL